MGNIETISIHTESEDFQSMVNELIRFTYIFDKHDSRDIRKRVIENILLEYLTVDGIYQD